MTTNLLPDDERLILLQYHVGMHFGFQNSGIMMEECRWTDSFSALLYIYTYIHVYCNSDC